MWDNKTGKDAWNRMKKYIARVVYCLNSSAYHTFLIVQRNNVTNKNVIFLEFMFIASVSTLKRWKNSLQASFGSPDFQSH